MDSSHHDADHDAARAGAADAPGAFVGLLTIDGHPLNHFDAQPPSAGGVLREAPRRKGGRAKDVIWNETTILPDKTVMCNHCNNVIHRYGCAKVERVRAHFQNRCVTSINNSGNSGNGNGNSGVKRQKTAHELMMTGGMDGGGLSNAALADKTSRRMDYIVKIGQFKRKFAQWVYATGLAFEDVENDFLASALRVLRADVPLPTREELGNELLDQECSASVARVNKVLLGKACCLSIENWTDATGVHNTNYATLCEGTPYFLESTAHERGRDAELAAEEVENVLAKHKKCLFYAVITPETAMISRATRERIQKKNPQCVFYYGCVLHALRLLVNDICVTLPWLGGTRESVNELLEVVSTNQKLRSQLPSLPRVNDDNASYSLQSRDAFDRIFESFECVLGAEKELYGVASRRDFVDADTLAEKETLKQIQDFVLGETFVQDLNRASKLLLPLQQQLQRFESERVSLSQVYHCFLELLQTYAAMDWVSKKDKALISSCIKDRLISIYGDAHGVAYMLDPMYLGAGMDAVAEEDVKNFIVSYCSTLEPAKVLAQLDKYKAMVHELKECNSTYWKMLELGEVRAFDFWIERRQFPQLQQLAWAVFSLPNASTTPARAFSTQCQRIHARFHAKLSQERLQKLTQVYCNSRTADVSELAMAGAAGDAASLFAMGGNTGSAATSAVL